MSNTKRATSARSTKSGDLEATLLIPMTRRELEALEKAAYRDGFPGPDAWGKNLLFSIAKLN